MCKYMPSSINTNICIRDDLLKMQMKSIKSEIISASRELQARGALYQIFSVFMII